MQAFTTLTSIAASLPDANIDTDIIFPARFLLHTEKKGLGKFAFYEKRFAVDGSENIHFVLNQTPFRSAKILVAGDNFGSGSSREQAPWALYDFGIRCIISTAFGEIFYANCFKNSMLPVVVSATQLAKLHGDAQAGLPLTVDLTRQKITLADLSEIAFSVPYWRRNALLNGWDEIAIIINQERDNIAEFEFRQKHLMPWLY